MHPQGCVVVHKDLSYHGIAKRTLPHRECFRSWKVPYFLALALGFLPAFGFSRFPPEGRALPFALALIVLQADGREKP